MASRAGRAVRNVRKHENNNKMAPAPATHTYSTAGTVSSPLDLDKVRGEHEAVNVNGGGRKISPKPKVTLTSLTVNNVSA